MEEDVADVADVAADQGKNTLDTGAPKTEMPPETKVNQRNTAQVDEQTANDRCPPAEGIWAKVTIDIDVRSSGKKYDRIQAKVVIAATNATTEPIPLLEPYHLPARNVFAVSAKTNAGDALRATASKSEICVRFDDRGRTIGPGETFEWFVEYVRMAEVYFEEMLAYDVYIEPQQMFQKVAVRKHQFTIGLTLHTPEGEKRLWRWLKRWRIHQRNSLRLNPKPVNSNAGSTYNFDTFDLIDEPFDLNVAAAYRFRSWIAHAFQLAVGAVSIVIIEHSPAWLEKLAAWLKAWRAA